MRLTTLGTGTIALSPERGCASHHVQAGAVSLLLDCGSGATRRLAEHAIPWRQLTHVAITHFHIDHHGDLPTLIFAWKYGMLPARTAPIDIIGPVGIFDLLGRLAAAYGDWVTTPGFEVRIREIQPNEHLDLGDGVALSCCKVPHTVESVAYSIERGGRRVVYTGDTGVSHEFAQWARNADVLVCECSLPASMAIPEHLTPEECGLLAAEAAPAHLALTHMYPPVERVDIPAAVRQAFSGPLTLARDGWTLTLEEN